MTECPDIEDLDDLWAGTWAPSEPSPAVHPSMWQRTDLPQRETAGVERPVEEAAAPPADPLAFFRGLGCAAVLSAPFWAAVVVAWRRWA